MSRQLRCLNTQQKTFIDAFERLTYSRHNWEVWSDFVTIASCSIANSVDHSAKRDEREQMYLKIVSRYKNDEIDYFAQMFAAVIGALELDPEQDFLGELFMALELGSHWHGQFFTPYSVCGMMAKMQFSENDKTKIMEKGYISVNDPACGAGALLIAFANQCRGREVNINYQEHVLFVAQDIDYTAAMMCYIQLSLLGCPGFVIVGDTLAHPPTVPLSETHEVWYTPFYFSDIWCERRLLKKLHQIADFAGIETKEPESGTNGAKTLPESPKAELTPPKVLSDSLNMTESGQLKFNIG